MILKFRKSLFFLLVPLMGAAAVFSVLHRSAPSFSGGERRTIVLDAGHGAPG
ncbi:MAG: hypothetical protein PUD92_05275 [Clostridiales bacterium]|nr:hypothetical protein [Clostridiales bacterium]